MPIPLRNTQGQVKRQIAYYAVDARRSSCDLRFMLNRLKEFRARMGISQEQMAERLGVSVSQVSRWESDANNIPSSRLPQLARGYRCRVGEIFDDIDPTPSALELADMIQIAMNELPVGVSYADYPRAVSTSLHAQLERFRAGGGFRAPDAGSKVRDKAARSPRPTTLDGLEESRTP